jgi:YD repeat-containing protein
MKRFFGFALMLAMIAAPAFGANKTQTVSFVEAVTVGTTQIPAGSYKLTWTGSGASVEATLTQGKKTIVTFTAKEIAGNSQRGLETLNINGVNRLQVIHMDKVGLQLENAAQAGN